MPDLTLKAHDSLPHAVATLGYDDGTWPDLTLPGTTCRFFMALEKQAPKVNAEATITQPDATVPPVVRYAWKHDGTDTNEVSAGWRGEWQVTFPDGSQQTFPGDGYHSIAILPDVDYYAATP